MHPFSTTTKVPFDRAVEQVIEALEAAGFGVLTDIDVQATLKTKLGVEKRPYRILGVCNLRLFNQPPNLESNIGLLLPCNLVIREQDDGQVTVTFVPVVVLGLVEQPSISALAKQLRERLESDREAVSARQPA